MKSKPNYVLVMKSKYNKHKTHQKQVKLIKVILSKTYYFGSLKVILKNVEPNVLSPRDQVVRPR